MSIRADGIVSGMNTSKIISELSAVFSRPKQLLEQRVSIIKQRQKSYTDVNALMSTIKTQLKSIQTITNFRSHTASTTDDSKSFFTAAADGNAIPGSYGVKVTQLAKSNIHVIKAYDSSGDQLVDNDSTELKAGIFTITWDYGSDGANFDDSTGSRGEAALAALSSAGFKDENDDDTFSSFEIEIEAGDTLATVASTINGVAGLNAYTMFDGLNYNLVIQSEKTGENFGFEASFDSTAQFDTDNTDETDALDATVEFNGVEVTSSSNTIKDAVQGLTINAIDTDSTERNVTVDVDVTKVSEKVKAFVTNYNAMVDFINKRNTYDKETGNMGVFFGDSTIRTLVTRFNTLLTQTYSSDTDGDSDVDSDDETLLTANDTEVTLDSLSTIGIEFATDSSGKLTFTESVFKTAIIDYQQDVEALFSGPDSDGNDYSFSAQMVTELKTAIQPFTGTLAKVDSLMTDQTKSLKNQITRWETRIKSYEARLLKQFTAMEKVAGSMNTMGSFLSSFFSKKSS